MTDLHHHIGDRTDMRRISNSEASTWLSCRAKYRYQFLLNLEPIKQKEVLSRGIIGHEALAIYYRAIKLGQDHDVAVRNARDYLASFFSTTEYSTDLLYDLDRILVGYFNHVKFELSDLDNWDILMVEEQLDIPISEDFHVPMTLDLLVRDKTTGDIILIDHKFFYDFPTQDDLALNAQLPKYVAILRYNGYNVTKAMINCIRYRKLKNPDSSDLFRRDVIKPSDAKLRNALSQHIMASQEILEYREMTEEGQKAKSLPVLNKMMCKGCQYANLCITEYDGGDVNFLMQVDYKSNERYGYNDE